MPPQPTLISRLVIYTLAVVATLAALYTRVAMTPWFGDRPVLILFLIPVILSAYTGGLGPGLVATAIAAVGTAFFIMPPVHTFAFERPVDRAQWLIFILVCVLMSVVTESLHRARRNSAGPASATVHGSGLRTEMKVRAGFAFALICLAGIGVMSFLSVTRQTKHAEENQHTELIIDALHLVLSATTDAETAERGYVITGNREFLEPYEESRGRIDAGMRSLRRLTDGDGDQQKRLDELTRLLEQRLAIIADNIDLREHEGFAAAQAAIATGRGKLVHDSIRELTAKMERVEDEFLDDRTARLNKDVIVTKAVIMIGSALTFSVVLVALFVIGGDFSRSRKTEAELREARDELEARVAERTEQLAKINETLKTSEARYRDFVQLSPHAMFINEDNRITFINEAGMRLFGAKKTDEILGRSPLELIHPDYHPMVRARIAQLLESPKSIPYVAQKMRRLDGVLIDVEVAAASYNADGRLVIQVVCQDITERKRIEMMTAQLAAIVQSSDDAIIGKTLGGVVTSWNHGAEATFGYKADEAVGRPILMLIPPERFEEEKVILGRIGRGENVTHFETVRVRKDGRRINVSVTISPIRDGTGKIVGASKIARDITEKVRLEAALRGSENRLRTLIDLIPDPIYMKDRERRFVLTNETTARFLGRAGVAELLGKRDEDFFPAAKAAGFQADEERIFTGIPLINQEESLVDAEGQRHTVLTTKIPLLDDAGDIVGLVGIGHDITERKKVEMVLAASERRFRTTLDNLMEGCQIIGHDWRYLYINTSAAKHNRKPAETLIGQTIMDSFPGIEDTAVFPYIRQCKEGGAPVDIEHEFTYADGSTAWFHLIMQSVPEGVFIISVDITARRETAEALRRRQEELRILFDLIPAMIWFKDTHNRHLRVNQRVADAIGMSVEQIEGRPCEEIYPDQAAIFYADDLTVIESGNPKLGIVEKIRAKNGATRWMQTDKVPYCDAAGAVVGIVVAAQDITERKLAERRLMTQSAVSHVLANAGSEGDLLPHITQALAESEGWDFGAIWEVDETAAVLRCASLWRRPGENLESLARQTEGMTFTRGVGLPGRVWESARARLSPDVANDSNYLRAPLAIQAGMRSALAFPIFQDGKVTGVMDFLSRETHLPDEKLEEMFAVIGSQIGLFMQRRRAQEEVRRLNAELEQRVIERTAQLESANRELESFSYSVSHDLRSPLRAVDGFSLALVEDFGDRLPPEARQYLGTIRGETQRMGELIDDLLTFSRLSRMPMEKQSIDTNTLVGTIWSSLIERNSGRNVDIVLGELAPCEGDISLLRQVWINLLSNALKYTGRKEKAVIEVGCRHENTGTVYWVKDNGAGFDMRYIHKLFGVFQRLHRAEDYEGTGVGLAIVQRIIHRHGGRVWAEAAVDQGATFYFTLN